MSSPPSSLVPSTQDRVKFRESLIKAVAVGGIPKAINSFLALKPHTPHLLDHPLGPVTEPSSRANDLFSISTSEILARGQTFFDTVYGPASRRVMAIMDNCGAPDLGITARLIYSYFFSNTAILTAAESSFVGIAGMIPQDVNGPLRNHLLGALRNGARREEVEAVREVVIMICEAVGMKRLDGGAPGGWGWKEGGWKEEVVKL